MCAPATQPIVRGKQTSGRPIYRASVQVTAREIILTWEMQTIAFRRGAPMCAPATLENRPNSVNLHLPTRNHAYAVHFAYQTNRIFVLRLAFFIRTRL